VVAGAEKPVSISEPFIRRPVATSLLTIAIALSGMVAFRLLPVSPLPQVDFPTIQVSASLPGASPETMASSVATPLERQFGHIAGVSEMTSSSNLGSTTIVLQFDLSRNIDAAARDVQAAINAALGNLPANLPSNPTYRKVNPADAPILILSVTSDIYNQAQMYDAASTILQQKIAQVNGVGQVFTGGSSLPAVRVELNPHVVSQYGVGMASIRSRLAAFNANIPKGELADAHTAMTLYANDQLLKADLYKPLIVGYRNGAPVRVSDLGTVTDSVEDIRTAGVVNGKPAVFLIIFRQPGANIIETVDSCYAVLPQLQASIPPGMHIGTVVDRTTTIRASVKDVERSLIISIVLVVLVVFVFLRNAMATFIPSVVVPLSLIGTFGVMYLLHYSLDNLSLMALTISTGFVVDDAIVVIENITRYLEKGMHSFDAALKGSKEIGFTVVTMSTSLVAVFIPILMMTGIVGRLFREFAVTLSTAIAVSMVVSLTATPMMCARFLKHEPSEKRGRIYQWSERAFDRILKAYATSLRVILGHPGKTLAVLAATIALNVFLFGIIPKGFFPQQDTGRLVGGIQAEQNISFQLMNEKLNAFVKIVMADPAVTNMVAFTGSTTGTNAGRMFVSLTDPDKRKETIDQVIGRIRKASVSVPGAMLFLQAVQDIRIGGRSANAQYQFTLQSQDLNLLNEWAPKVMQKLKTVRQLVDLNTDQQNNGLSSSIVIDRDTASRLGLTAQNVDDALYDAFGQRQVSTMYTTMNQYHVVMEVAPEYWQNPQILRTLYAATPSGRQVPFSAFARWSQTNTPLVVNHQGQFPSVTFSFNLPPGIALGQAVDAIHQAMTDIRAPAALQSRFSGTAQAFQDSLANEPILILTALIAVYIVLGMLYESYIHPVTILSTLPSAGVGALLAMLITHNDLNIIALIGIILLIGLVKKNAILMIDFALEAERKEGKNSEDAIYEACLLRFRPIMMTTMAALLGALPLALGRGTGSELRRPLGISIIGGLIVSQMLTLFTTPIVYLFMDRLRIWFEHHRGRLKQWIRLQTAEIFG
jgi:multidrug efflux pump